MKEIQHYIPEDAVTTIDLVETLNQLIRQGKPDAEVVHVALTGLVGLVGQLEHAMKSNQP